MRVVVPATPDGLHPRTLPAILRQGWDAEVMTMQGVEDYYWLVNRLWAERAAFALVEHDVEAPPGALDALAECPEPWCAHSYEVFVGDVAENYGGAYCLGLSRFRPNRLPEDAVLEAGKLNVHPVHPPRSYAVMDSTLTQVLRAHGLEVHQHFPNATHHHHYLREGAFMAPPRTAE